MRFRIARLAALLPLLLFPSSRAAAAGSDLEVTVTRMARIGSSSRPSFSPDGKTLAFLSNLGGSPQVWTVPATGGWPTLVTPFDDPVGGLEWSPDGAWLAFTVAPGGGMNAQVYLVHPDGTGLKRITEGGKETNRLFGFRHDGAVLGIGSNRRSGAAIDSYVYDMATGKHELVSVNPGVGGIDSLSRDGKQALVSRLRFRGRNDLVLLDLASRKETPLTPGDGPATFAGAFSPDGRTIWVLSNKDRDLLAFGRIRIGPGGAPSPIEILAERSDAELSDFVLDDTGQTILLHWNVGGKSELSFFDVASSKVTPGPALPSERAGGFAFSHDGTRLALSISGSTAPSDVFILDMKSKALSRITRSPHAGVDLASLVKPELVRFPAHDGLVLSGWLYRPRGQVGPGPTVLSFHGGPEGQETPGFRSDYQALLSQGIAVLAPNVRGSSGFGKRFVNLDNGALRADGVKDIKACVDYVVKAGVADPKRLGIMGGSYGGYMTMAGLTEYPNLFAAGANLFGVVNFRTFFKHTEPWMAAISKVEYGDPDTEGEMLDRLSPIFKLDRITAATLVLHGANDTNVPVVEAEQIVESLKKRGAPVSYVLFPDEGHGFQKTPNRIRSTVSIAEWFAKYLK